MPPGIVDTLNSLRADSTYEEVRAAFTEKSQLLSITTALSKTSDTRDLLRVIYENIKPLFPYDSAGLFVIDEDNDLVYEILDGDAFPDELQHQLTIENKLGPWKLSTSHPESWWMTNEPQPVITSLEHEFKLIEKGYLGMDQFKAGIALGLKQLIGGPLYSNGKKIGAICFSSKSANYYTPQHFTLFNGISQQIAIALSHVIANEAIMKKEKEKEGLVKVIEAISKVSSKDKLLNTIFSYIHPLFPFDATGLYVINEEKDLIYEIASGSVFNSETEQESTERRTQERWKYSTSNKQSWWCSESNVVINDLQTESNFAKGYLGEDQFELGLAYGLKHMIGGPLLFNGKKIGALCFNSSKENFYTRHDIDKFKIISEQLAVAVGKILYIEEIIEKDKEKSVLLSISESIAKISNRKTLFETIQNKVRPLIPFDDVVIIVLNKDKNKWFDWSVEDNLPETVGTRKLYAGVLYDFNPMDEITANPVAEAGTCSIDNIVVTKNAFAEKMVNTGLKDFAYAPLNYRGEKIGSILFSSMEYNTYSEMYFDVIKIIADMIAAAVNNIIAREEIENREKEKSELLSISNEINCIKDLNSIIDWLQRKMKSFVGADYTMITLVNERKNKAYYVLSEATAEWQLKGTGSARKGIIDSGITLRGSFFEYLETLADGTVYSLEDVPKQVNNIPFEFCEKLGIKESFPVKLINKEQIIGHLCIHSTEPGRFQNLNISTLKNIVNQVSIALVNILNTEDLIEKEKQKDLEISINNAVLINESFGDVMGEISTSINKAVGCDICYIRVLTDSFDPGPFHFFCEKTENKFSVRAVDAKVTDTGITPRQAGKNAEEFLTTMQSPTILSGMRLEELTPQYQYLQIFTQKIGIRSFIFLPLQLKYNCIAYLIIGSRTAYAYIENDLDLIVSIKTQLSLTLDNRLAFHQINHLKELLETENLYLQEELHENYNFNEIIGSSNALKNIFNQASMVAGTDSTVLLIGETGTGKELVARAIHNLSPRKDKAMVKVNCACLPVQLIESELFGHEKGAFTGAIERRIGKFELANGGTIFLDEIGELPLELQAKLLRVIQEREFERLGGKSTFKTDIRIIAATNKDLKIETDQKRFRSDLYYRLNVFPILLPSLRERKEDIPLLAMHFANKFSLKMRKQITAIQNESLQEMMLYDWPGNVRELEHVIEHSVISCKSPKLTLSKPLLAKNKEAAGETNEFRIKTLQETEREHILNVLRYCKGRVRGAGGAAQLLDVNPNTLESRMIKLGIKKQHVFA